MEKGFERKNLPHNTTERKSWFRDPGNGLLVIYIGIIIFLLLFSSLENSGASEEESAPSITLEDVRQGELLLPATEQGRFVRVPQLSQEVRITISGIVARVIVKQRFTNPTTEWIEALYVFPLPDESAVDHLRMRVGERTIVGQIQEKKKARAIYEKARKEGKKSSLLVQNRANIFTTAVANIGPGETVQVEIEYQQMVQYGDGIFSFNYPLVVGPRYIPGTPLGTEQKMVRTFSATGWARDTDQVPDASSITPPILEAGKAAINPVELFIELAPGFKVSRIDSLYHGIKVEEKKQNVYSIRFSQQVFADRDFVLEYRVEQGDKPKGALFVEEKDNHKYMLLMLMPPKSTPDYQRVPREMIFVVDTSGSMAGASMRQAVEALVMAISRLSPADRFNVIEFNSTSRALYTSVRPGDKTHIREAIRFVRRLKAEGGTEVKPALERALDGRKDHKRIRQVVFLTDGDVGNEAALFKTITSRLGDSRLFTIGIGSAPNRYFMTRAASLGRGTFTYVGKIDEVQERMERLFQKLENPVVSSLAITTDRGVTGETQGLQVFPSPLPDLYLGEPLLAAIRVDTAVEHLNLSGTLAGQPWELNIDAGTTGDRQGIAPLWARKKIRSLMESRSSGADPQQVREQILAVALEHHLVSKYTSLVAVEEKASRPEGEQLHKAPLKTNLPAGWEREKVFGGGAQTATPAELLMIIGVVMLLAAGMVLVRQGRSVR